jgi:F-type H+-transporting ATPase subunit delta
MSRSAGARRYGKALFQLAREAGNVEATKAELEGFAATLDGSQELRDVLLRPLYPAAQRRAVLNALSERAGASQLVRNFYTYLIDQRRLVDVDAIRDEYQRLADEEAGLTKATLRSATPLRADQLEQLRRVLSQQVGGEVELSVEIDPELIAGLVAQVGDIVFDGSLRTQLRQLRTSLGQY